MRPAANTKTEVIARVQRHQDLLRELGVERLGLFGSFARGEAGPESDVDFLVDFAEGEKTYDHFLSLAHLLEDLLARRVEVLTREGLSPHLGPRILAEVEDVPLRP